MNKQTLIWVMIVAVPVGIAALVTGYNYRETGQLPFQDQSEVSAPKSATDSDKPENAATTADAGKPSEAGALEPDQTAEAAPSADPQADGPADTSKPSFDVVGVEPTGETVVAGRSDAGAIVALTANGEVVGKSIANEAGEWTIILDEPLKPGDYDVGLEVHDQSGDLISGSEERVAVSIPQGGKEQPLVVLNSPDGPSDILQKPEAATSDAVVDASATGTEKEPKAEETVVAAAQPSAEQNNAAADTAPNETKVSETSSAGEGSAKETGTAAAASAAQPEKEQVQTETAAAGDSAATSEEKAVAAGAPADTAEPAKADDTATGNTQSAAASEESAPQTAAGEQPQETAAIKSGQGGQPSETPAAATSASVATEPAAASSEPETSESETQVAAAPAAKPANKAPESKGDASVSSDQAQDETPSVTVEAVESEKDKVYVAGTGDPGSSVRVYVGDDYQGEAKVGSSGKWLVEGSKNVAEGNVEVRADMIGNDGSTVDARAAVVFEKEQDQQIVLTKVVVSGSGSSPGTQGANVQKALPQVIIRKGDNLWRISRRLYGDGVRYTTIYQANKGQIRDPDLIYPGQVFLTPENDLNWPKPDTDNGRNG